ncbi:hypothetical protein PILCRDRAFT_3683 [Piloderma croceum F 1598]|uniref:CxC2-like cysteine cluster KDZ transposase-associated domain-containing protein n=1 Tax=Piloderma croceum (strain F 1598) TaxID=765440 RepID=A0A0C3G887_PILCF|nr:hypothetical protein PILCRDRAFT_3683 [Piloderma croceum F 1598]
MLKRAGRGQDPLGCDATQEGELAFECPACPHPGCNLPEGWDKASPEIEWLHTLFIATNANYRSGLKDKGICDVELAPGWGSFVEETRFQNHLTNYPNQKEINTCKSQHDAVLWANSHGKEGWLVSGTGLAQCGHHALVHKNGIGDLQKREKYCNMDYIILLAIISITLLRLVITYDIACQWSKNFASWMVEYPEHMHVDLDRVEVRTAVPGFHICAHGADCQRLFSLGLMLWVANTVGKEVESGWAHMNVASPSIQEMGPSNMHESLNDHWGSWNFQKIIMFRTLFRKRFKEAFTMRAKHQELFNKFNVTFKPGTVQKWEAAVRAWDVDEDIANPYEEPVNTMTQRDIRLQLVKEEEADASRGILPLHKISPSTFLSTSLELEEQQRSIRLLVSFPSVYGTQRGKVLRVF